MTVASISERQEDERRQVMLEREKMRADRETQEGTSDAFTKIREQPVIEQLNLIEEGMGYLAEQIDMLEKVFDPVLRKNWDAVKGEVATSGEKDLDPRGQVLQRLERINSNLNKRITSIRDIVDRVEV